MVDEEELYLFKKIIPKFDKPFFPPSISSKKHIIFLKYTSPKYRTYIIGQLKTLSNKLHNTVNKSEIFYASLLLTDLILYNCGNEVIIDNINLLIFCSFYLTVKFRLIQYDVMSIKTLKKFNPQKFYEYTNDEIKMVETLSLKLLNYKLNFMTCYDYLFLLMNEFSLKKKVIEYSIEILNEIICGDIKEYIFKSPLKLAKDVIYLAKEKYNTNDQNNSLINSISISTNSSSIQKNNDYYSDINCQIFSEKKNIKKEGNGYNIIKQENESNKAIYIEPLYSVSSRTSHNFFMKNENKNGSIYVKYEIDAFPNACHKKLNEENGQKREIKKFNKYDNDMKNENVPKRYLINVNLAKQMFDKIRLTNNCMDRKLSILNEKHSENKNENQRGNSLFLKTFMRFKNVNKNIYN